MGQPETSRPSVIIFDLDGTLWDTSATCTVAWNDVLNRLNINFREITPDDVRRVTGQPHEDGIRSAFAGLPESDLKRLIDETAEENNRALRQRGGELYPGVVEGLEQLYAVYPLYIVSNCQSGYIETFLSTSGLEPLFSDFECWGNTGRSKWANLRSVIERNDLVDPVFIGDTDGDLQAAQNADIPFIQVTYGFGTPIPDVKHYDNFAAMAESLLWA